MKLLHYEFEIETGEEDYEIEEWYYNVDYSRLREAIVDIYETTYSKEPVDRKTILDFIYLLDLEDDLGDILEGELKEYFKDEAYKEFLDLREI